MADRLSSPEAVVEDFCEADEPFRTGWSGTVVFLMIGTEGLLRLPKDGRAWTVRAASVLDPVGDKLALRLGFAGLGVRERDSRAECGDAILERRFPFNPTVDGVFIKVPIVRPRIGVVSGALRCAENEPFVEASWLGPALEPGLLSAGSDGGVELSEGRRDRVREPRLLVGLDIGLGGSASKKFEIDTLLFRAGEGCKCDSVSMVLSAKDGRGFGNLARLVSSVPSFSTGLFCNGELLDDAPADMLLILGVRCLVRVPWYNHDAEACLLSAGNLDVGAWSRGESCSGRAVMGSRGSREKAWFVVGFGSFGSELEVGRYEVGRGLGRVFAAVGVRLEGFALVIGGGRFVKFPIPKLGPALKRSLEAEGRKRVGFASPPLFPDKFSLDGDGRMPVDLGVGRRDIGRGRPLDLPAVGR